MLVLSHRPGEEIVIDGEIRVRVVAISGNRVKLALAAPLEMSIQPAELQDRPADSLTPVGIGER